MDPARRIEALLASLTNYERTRPDRPRFGLDTMRALLGAAADDAPRRTARLQIGGSKGKGTTAHYVAAWARRAGLRTVLFQSPHVDTVLERVQIDGADIDADRLEAILVELLEAARRRELAPSFFEIMAAAAERVLERDGFDLGIFEVGLGGRLDATTAIDVDASILTSIELEHTDVLGDTVEAIAAEKAWIARAGRPVFVLPLPAGADAVVAAHAERVGAQVRRFGVDFGTGPGVANARGAPRELWAFEAGQRVSTTVAAADVPPHEWPSLVAAWAALRAAVPDAAPALAPPTPGPFSRPTLPGRFEVREDDRGVVVLDGAHTAESFRVLRAALAWRFPTAARATMLFATAADKRWQAALSEVVDSVDSVLVTALAGTRSADPAAIAAWLGERGVPARVVPEVETAIAAVRATDGLRLVAGSFYLVGEVRRRL